MKTNHLFLQLNHTPLPMTTGNAHNGKRLSFRKHMALCAWVAVCMRCGAALPMSVVSFTASEPDENGAVQLNWVVSGPSSSYGTIRFNVAVSRSETDDLMTSTILAGGYSMTQYGVRGSLVDTPPVAGKTYYYWLNCAPYNSNVNNNFNMLYLNGYDDSIHNTLSSGPIAVYVPAPLTLSVESADWFEKSIRLKCEDSGGSGPEHQYTLSYYDEDGEEWVDIEGAMDDVEGEGDGNVYFTDRDFLVRLGGIPPVKYHVRDENGRVSNECVTRNRHGILVGLNRWEYDSQLPELPGEETVEQVYERIHGDGGFLDSNIRKCLNATATANIQDVDAAFRDVAAIIEKGDICLFYFSTHGGINQNGDAVLCLNDGEYTDRQLAAALKALDQGSGDVAKIGIISACHSGALYDNPYQSSSSTSWYMANDLAQCSVNVAWITAADAASSAFGLFDLFMFEYGWRDGWAGNGDSLSLLQLANYTSVQYGSLFADIVYEGEQKSKAIQIENEPLLSTIMVAKPNEHGPPVVPDVPSGFKASQGEFKDKITLSWDYSAKAEMHLIFHRYSGHNFTGTIYVTTQNTYDFTISSTGVDSREYYDFMNADSENPLIFVVKAVNGTGITSSRPFEANGWVDSSWEIRFDANKGEIREPWMGEEPQHYATGDVLVKTMSKGDILQLDDGPKAKREGFIFVGWYDEQETKLLSGMAVYEQANYTAKWTHMTQEWFNHHQPIVAASNGDIATAAAMVAANGRCTVGECYALGINPEDPNDDLTIVDFRMEDDRPVISLNHTEDGSGNSFLPRVKTLGKTSLADAEWSEVPKDGDTTMRFFKVSVEMP